MVTAQQMTGIYENQTQITKRPYVFTSSFCPTFPTYNETYDLNWDGHEISSAEECLFAVMNLTGGGGLNPVKVFDASTLRYSNLTWLHDAGQPQLSQEPFLFPCGCYLYHGPQHDEMYEWWNELESPAASHVAPDPWTFGSEDSYVFAFYAGGEKSGSLADGNYDPMCSINDENHFTKQLDWMNSCRETIAIKADVSVDQVKNLTLTKKSTQRRFLRNLNVQVGYDLQFVIMFDNYTSSQDSVSALEDSLELDPVTKSKSPFAEMFFSTYVLKSGGEYYFCEEEAQPALSWESPFHVIEGIIVFPVHIDASHVYSELKAEFDRKSEDSALLPSEYLARLHDGFVLAVCDVDPVHGDVLGTFAVLNTIDSSPDLDVVELTPDPNSNMSHKNKHFLEDTRVLIIFIISCLVSLVVIGYVIYSRVVKMSKLRKDLELARKTLESYEENVKLMQKGWTLKFSEIELIEQIGVGSCGTIFKGKLRGSIQVAIKVIEVEKEETWVQIRKDDPEIGLMTRCRHPRLVMFLGYGVIPNQGHFIVLEYMSCGSLDSKLWRFGRFGDETIEIPSWRDRLLWLRDISEAMVYLHDMKNVIHRDLKSQNVLLSYDFKEWFDHPDRPKLIRAKVADFNTSKFCNSLGVARKACGIVHAEEKTTTSYNTVTSIGERPSLIRCCDKKKLGKIEEQLIDLMNECKKPQHVLAHDADFEELEDDERADTLNDEVELVKIGLS
eukprot:g1648.t1